MARYFFNFGHVTDDQGVELDTLAEAKCEAVRQAANLICNAAERFWDTGEFKMDVTDENGLVLFTLVMAGIEAPAINRE